MCVWKYISLEVPAEIWESLLPQEDNQIGVTEAMAVTLAIECIRAELEDNCIFSFIGNAGTMAGFVNGASRNLENIMISESWIEFARARIASQFWRLAS